MEYIENIDRQIFLFLNSLNTSWLDPIMSILSSFWIWYIIVVLFIFFIYLKFKKSFWKPLVVAIICFALTDQSSNLIKHSVKRYRPSHNVEISNKVHIVNNYKGGLYSFVSGHACNSFGLALITLLFIKNKKWSIFVFTWACLVSYSRIYVGVHYPSDLLFGAILGICIAYIVFKTYNLIPCLNLKNNDTCL